MEEKLPLKGTGLVYICLIYAGMGGIAVFVSIVVGKIDIALRDRSLLLSSILAASLGLCL